MKYIIELGELLNHRIQQIQHYNKFSFLEFGCINDDFSLTADSLKDTIPKDEYLISSNLQKKECTYHETICECMCGIKSGDRVLIAWVGNSPVILDILISETER